MKAAKDWTESEIESAVALPGGGISLAICACGSSSKELRDLGNLSGKVGVPPVRESSDSQTRRSVLGTSSGLLLLLQCMTTLSWTCAWSRWLALHLRLQAREWEARSLLE